ncbi:MAG: protoporphyrinogen oxidase HemJ [Alphaproteobacteria bacterium]|nr:protoporphyrinogen oxidase HemJ [Alphaproteobacteria bacterium]
MTWLTDFYPWIKAFHVISVIAWMAGLLYLPRLFVYHCEAPEGSRESETFKTMERRLLRAIMNPAMITTYIFGGLLLATPGVADWGAAWLWCKLALIGGLTVMHHLFALWQKDFLVGHNTRSAGFYRAMNEVPTAMMIGIVVMVIVRPF